MGNNALSARELQEKYKALLAENGRLREEIGFLNDRLRDESLPASLPDMQNTRGAETPDGGHRS